MKLQKKNNDANVHKLAISAHLSAVSMTQMSVRREFYLGRKRSTFQWFSNKY